jgi:hypothetical protein
MLRSGHHDVKRDQYVTGILPGTDRARATEALVLGAHYDHLGRTVRLGEIPVGSFEELRRTIAAQRAGEAVAVLYLRDGTDEVTTVTLDADR